MNVQRLCLAMAVIVGIIVITFGVMIATINPTSYRGELAQVLSKQLGREVQLNGPISLRLTGQGVTIVVEDVTVGNPTWASRPHMITIKRLELGVELLPLVHRQFIITNLTMSNADIQLETGDADQHNWNMHPNENGTPQQKSSLPVSDKETAETPHMAIVLHNIAMTDSRMAIRTSGGKTVVFTVKKMALGPEGRGLVLNFEGDYNGASVNLNLKTDTTDIMADAVWPYQADLMLGDYHLTARGHANYGAKIAELNPYELTIGSSAVHGQISFSFNGDRPDARGTLIGEKLDPKDLKPLGKEDETPPPAVPTALNAPAPPKLTFSDAPLPLEILKAANGNIDVTLGELPLNHVTLRQIAGTLDLNNGRLLFSPVKAMLGDSILEGQIKLDAGATPPQFAMSLRAPGADLSDLFHLGGIESFLSGKADVDIDLTGSGTSVHDLASSANGQINLVAAGGTISDAAADQISSGLMELFMPGADNSHPTMNCLAARFVVTNGIVHDNGVLLDTSTTTIAGSGSFNLRDETSDFMLRAKPKIGDVGGLLPPLHISGTFLKPKFVLDTSATVQNVAGLLSQGTFVSAVPDLLTQQGQNACLNTLNHQQTSQSSQTGTAQNMATKLRDQIKNISGKLKGLLEQ